jgi:hypothetical protein
MPTYYSSPPNHGHSHVGPSGASYTSYPVLTYDHRGPQSLHPPLNAEHVHHPQSGLPGTFLYELTRLRYSDLSQTLPAYQQPSSGMPYAYYQAGRPQSPYLPASVPTNLNSQSNVERTAIARYPPIAGIPEQTDLPGQHMGGSLSSGSKYECSYCGKGFTRPSSLKVNIPHYLTRAASSFNFPRYMSTVTPARNVS